MKTRVCLKYFVNGCSSTSIGINRFNRGTINNKFLTINFQNITRETKIVNSGSILIVQLLRYDNFKGAVIKNKLTVNCSKTLKLPISGDEQVCLYKEFNLKANINHSGTLQAGHYWAHIKDKDNLWLVKM